MLADLNPDLAQLIIGIVTAIVAFFGARHGSRRD